MSHRARVLFPLGLLLAVLASIALRPRPTAAEELRWTNGTVELAGSLYLPDTEGPHPAAVFVHGAGAWIRDEALFRVHAERLSRRGLAVLIYDKRGSGESGGARGASFAALAGDALAAVDLLARDPRIRPGAVGLLATSQGGAIALLAASRSPRVSFLATLSLSPLSPAEQAHSQVEGRLRASGRSAAEIAAAVALSRRIAAVYRDNAGWDGARAALDAARAEPWFAPAGIELWPRDGPQWRRLRDLPLDFDPLPYLKQLAIPLFAAQGGDDDQVPGPRAAGVLRALGREQRKDFTVVLVAGTGHALRVRGGWPFERWTWPESYWEPLERWLAETNRVR